MIRTILACIVGFLVGSCVNMAIVLVGPAVIPPPPGVDLADAEALAQNMQLLRPQHFIAPFLAHAIGTLVGSLAAFTISSAHKVIAGYVVGALFFLGGVMAASMIPAPWWFVVIDLGAAYGPMSYVGVRVGQSLAGRQEARGDV